MVKGGKVGKISSDRLKQYALSSTQNSRVDQMLLQPEIQHDFDDDDPGVSYSDHIAVGTDLTLAMIQMALWHTTLGVFNHLPRQSTWKKEILFGLVMVHLLATIM